MDQNLPGNHQFRLNEDRLSNNNGKIYIFVKLTDSCMRTIETYIKRNSSNKSNIKFNLNGGVGILFLFYFLSFFLYLFKRK
jgi:hypothetical protein